ncbi:EGF-like domain-containing protein [Phthorimaea operculella]|nr:EGF-like domain-containing protein [Phthorimaea operculella]
MALWTLALITQEVQGSHMTSGPLGPSDRPEAYFNGSSYIRLGRPISLKQLVGLSFRTCVGGNLFSQRFEGYTLRVTATIDQVVVSWARPDQTNREVGLARETLDNRWHWVALRYRPSPPSLLLEVDREQRVCTPARVRPTEEWRDAGQPLALGGAALPAQPALAAAGSGPGAAGMYTSSCQTNREVGLARETLDNRWHWVALRYRPSPPSLLLEVDREQRVCTPARVRPTEEWRDAGQPLALGGAALPAQPALAAAGSGPGAAGMYTSSCQTNREVGLARETLDNCWHWVALRYRPSPPSLLLEVDREQRVCTPARVRPTEEWRDAGQPLALGGAALPAQPALAAAGSGPGAAGMYTSSCLQTNREVGLARETLDNRWHWEALRYRPSPPSLLLEVDREQRVIANVTWNPELLAPGDLEAGGAVTLVGTLFSGCIHEGPQLEFHAAHAQLSNVLFGHCPLSTDECKNRTDVLREPPIDYCYNEPCMRHGTCISRHDRTDVLREPPIDYCYNEPCMRHGTCISRHDRYECHCTARYTGNNCEVDAGDPCRSAPCQHNGRCIENAHGDYTCDCPHNYHGLYTSYCMLRYTYNCEVDAGDPCRSGPCQHNGRCIENAHGDYTCDCPHNYHGQYCELEVSLHPLCEGTPNGPCLNNGSCSVPPSQDNYVCACPPGFTGVNCETNIDECAGSVGACLNGGRCKDGVNNFTCDCSRTGYTGARCEVNVNECEEDKNICGHGACYDTYGSYVCACQPGYTGDNCQTMSACASAPCGAGGACFEEAGGSGFRCVCAKGWEPPTCHVLIAPPEHRPNKCPTCPPRSHCRETSMPSVVGAVITKQVFCVCDQGYYGAPGLSPNCTTLENACEAGVCLNGATCSQAIDHFNCTCAPGFKGSYCETAVAATAAAGKALSELKAERCAQQPCLHARTCHDRPLGFHCDCEAGWSGARCDVPVPALGALASALPPTDPCAARPCLNGGSCHEATNAEGFVCECRLGFVGALCDKPVDCRAMGCPQHQECMEQNGAWRCSVAVDESACASSPCNNGTCLVLDKGLFKCNCPTGYNALYRECMEQNGAWRCSVAVDESACASSPCNNGTCLVLDKGLFKCNCPTGYNGKLDRTWLAERMPCEAARLLAWCGRA